MSLRLYNTASRSIEDFAPLRPPVVTMYCCGPTVYNYAHIGNLRSYLFEDVLRRTLQALGYTVKHVENITDVGHLTSDEDTGEDKMEKGARREGKTVWDIARMYTDKFMENIRDLNILPPTVWCKATDHIPEMIAQVRLLEEKGFTYRTSDGIYFDTSRFPAYGEFARLDPESIQAGVRVDMGEKRNPMDFALWKFSPTDAKRQMEWESPWGVGFPGWHIECSAMSLKYLGQPVDIHCGGTDHIRVHHTNEIAQVEASTGKPFVRFWLHGEFLVMDKGKMAKSDGTFITLDSVKDAGINPLAYRMFTYSSHYRSPLTFSWDGLAGAVQGLGGLKKIVADVKQRAGDPAQVDAVRADEVLKDFWSALSDDLNTPRAVASIWEMLRDGRVTDAEKLSAVKRADEVLALDLLRPDETHAVQVTRDGVAVTISSPRPVASDRVEDVVNAVLQRRAAKKAKDYSRADQVRAGLLAQGVEVRDLPGGAVECMIR